MGRRKIEIKAIKDDRNRSVTFLKRKGGLFKKAHELSVLCSVDVAVFIFGNNKKLYEYSSTDMRELMGRHQYHNGASEHKGPADFNGGNDDDDDEDMDGTPPRGPEGVDSQMMPPQFHGQHAAPFPQIRHHTPSASPPIPNGGPFPGHPSHGQQRSGTPQGHMGSRPGSRNDMRRMGPNMVPHNAGPHGPHPGITYMPTPPIYNPSTNQPGMSQQHSSPYSYPPNPQHQQHHQPHPQQAYMDDRRPSAPPTYPPPPPHGAAPTVRMEASPHPPPPQQLPPHPGPHISPPPQPERREPQPPPPVVLKTEPSDRPQPPLLNTESAIKKLPQRKTHSIFTPVEDNRPILSQHFASFAAEPQSIKTESASHAAAAAANRAHSVDGSAVGRKGANKSPRALHRSTTQDTLDQGRNASVSSGNETGHTPPSRASSLKVGGPAGGTRPRAPRLTVQIPDGGSEPGSATGESNSPRNLTDTQSQAPQRNSSMVLPPPSPSGPALLSAGATGPPNPFARPPPQQSGNNNDTPVSALPSRFLNTELLPSPSSFYPSWNFPASDSNTLPSPLNFATPVVGSGPSFLRDDHHAANHNSGGSNNNSGGAGASNTGAASSAGSGGPSTTATSGSGAGTSANNASGPTKRKSPDFGEGGGQSEGAEGGEAKRVKVEEAAM